METVNAVVLSGAPGVGKTSLAEEMFDQHWYATSPRARRRWRSASAAESSVAGDAAAAATGAFARADCRVVYDGFILPGDLPGFAAAAGLSVLHYAEAAPKDVARQILDRLNDGGLR